MLIKEAPLDSEKGLGENGMNQCHVGGVGLLKSYKELIK